LVELQVPTIKVSLSLLAPAGKAAIDPNCIDGWSTRSWRWAESESASELVLVSHLEWALEFHLGWESEKESGMILPFATPGTFHQSDTTRHTLLPR
jgi:hypothetical protein